MFLKKNDVILFQGDSITDSKRDRESYDDLGRGYAYLAASWLLSMYPELKLTFLNKGIGGNTVVDLNNRWKQDCIDIKPTCVSIMIGVNDCHKKFMELKDIIEPNELVEFKEVYRNILNQVKTTLNARIILLDPYMLNVKEDFPIMRKRLNLYIDVVRELAQEFHTAYIPMDGIFAHASIIAPMTYWTPDGFHVSPAGSALIARSWIKAVEEEKGDQ